MNSSIFDGIYYTLAQMFAFKDGVSPTKPQSILQRSYLEVRGKILAKMYLSEA